MTSKARPSGYLPRLPDSLYCGKAYVFWTLTTEGKQRGWLTNKFHLRFREMLLHASARENLICPVYVLMPDHVHLLWLVLADTSRQRVAMAFLRTHIKPQPAEWQHQPHDSVLKEAERECGAFQTLANYILQNPVRAKLVEQTSDWPHFGALAVGYPDLHPLQESYWDKFWKIYQQKLKDD